MSTSWTREENKKFEVGLAYMDERDPQRWEKIAALLPGKNVGEIEKHYMDLVVDINNIDAGLIEPPDYHIERSGGPKKTVRKPKPSCTTDGRWSENEHRSFLQGLIGCGKGQWAAISRNFVPTKTPMQIATHAQKYFLRLEKDQNSKKRSSIFDITTADVK